MLSLYDRLIEMVDKKTDARTKLEEQIVQVGREIDSTVYGLYKIEDAERKIIENSLKEN